MGSKSIVSVAVADDHSFLREAIVSSIKKFEGYNVIIEANDGTTLIEQLEHCDHLPDIILLDISMPKMDAYQALPILKKKWPSIKILIISMYDEEYSIIKMLKEGASGYMLKGTADPQTLREALHTVYSNNYYFSKGLSNDLVTQAEEKALPEITDKELEFLKYCSSGLSYQEISEKMEISLRTVEGHATSLCHKLNIKNRIGLVIFALKTGIVRIESK